MSNLYKALLGLLPQRPLLVGTVTSIAGGIATIELPDGKTVQARGDATVATKVYFRDGAIEGVAPDLTVVLIDV